MDAICSRLARSVLLVFFSAISYMLAIVQLILVGKIVSGIGGPKPIAILISIATLLY